MVVHGNFSFRPNNYLLQLFLESGPFLVLCNTVCPCVLLTYALTHVHTNQNFSRIILFFLVQSDKQLYVKVSYNILSAFYSKWQLGMHGTTQLSPENQRFWILENFWKKCSWNKQWLPFFYKNKQLVNKSEGAKQLQNNNMGILSQWF